MENYSYNSSYPESGHSSPRSREIDFENPPPWEESQSQPPPNYKVKFMCSYGGKIHPRPNDNQLSYIGGETKILAVDRNIKFVALLAKLIALCDSDSISFKYQLPGEDLDALISVTNDDDLEHMMVEYDRLYRVSPKPARLRIFIFPSVSPSLNSSTRSFGSDEVRTEKDRFLDALNSAPIISAPQQSASPVAVPQMQPPAGNVDFLFGLEKANAMVGQPPVNQPTMGRVQEFEDPVAVSGLDERLIASDPIQKHIQDLQRLRLEEQQQGNYRRKSEDSSSGGYTGGEYYRVPEKIPQVAVPGGVPYWSDRQVTGGVYPTSTVGSEQPVYMIQAPANAYPAPMMRPVVTGAPTQGYYAVQRVPSDVYREQQQLHQQQQQLHQQQQQLHQQQHMYNVISQGAVPSMAAAPPSLPPQKVAGYSEGFGMGGRPAATATGGIITEGGYAQVAYDNAAGRQVIYSAPGAVMGAPPPAQVQAAQYQAMAAAATADMRQGGALNTDAGGKVVSKVTQTSM